MLQMKKRTNMSKVDPRSIILVADWLRDENNQNKHAKVGYKRLAEILKDEIDVDISASALYEWTKRLELNAVYTYKKINTYDKVIIANLEERIKHLENLCHALQTAHNKNSQDILSIKDDLNYLGILPIKNRNPPGPRGD